MSLHYQLLTQSFNILCPLGFFLKLTDTDLTAEHTFYVSVTLKAANQHQVPTTSFRNDLKSCGGNFSIKETKIYFPNVNRAASPDECAAPGTVKLSNQIHETEAQPPAKHKYLHHEKSQLQIMPFLWWGSLRSAACLRCVAVGSQCRNTSVPPHLKEDRQSVLKINERVAANRGTSATGSPARCSAASLKEKQRQKLPLALLALFTLFALAFPRYRKRTSPYWKSLHTQRMNYTKLHLFWLDFVCRHNTWLEENMYKKFAKQIRFGALSSMPKEKQSTQQHRGMMVMNRLKKRTRIKSLGSPNSDSQLSRNSNWTRWRFASTHTSTMFVKQFEFHRQLAARL